MTYIENNLKRIKAELAAESTAAGYPAPELIAVTKSATDEEVLALAAAGVTQIGENRTSMLTARRALLEGAGYSVSYHLIGSLQTNKAKEAVGVASVIHSLDRPSLAAAIEKLCVKSDITQAVLAEVNIGREEAKGGLDPSEVVDFCRSLSAYPHLRLCGLMTMAPADSSPKEYKEYFTRLRLLSEELAALGLYATDRPMLSMGMSGSYREAAACGATHVRVGRSLFTM